MKTIKAKQPIVGSYGVLNTGETAEVTDKLANELEKSELAEVVSEGEADTEDEKKSDAGVNITDNTKKEKKDVLVKDEKKSDAGPNAKK